jgi:hypothetical protein
VAGWDWVTISALATAFGTLVLALATFAAVRSANKASRTAERSLLAGLRPVLGTSRLDDTSQKVLFADPHWMVVEGGQGAAEATDDAIFLAMSVRNVGAGMAVLHGWHFSPDSTLGTTGALTGHDLSERARLRHVPLDQFRRQSRDIYIPPNDLGFWQGAFRDRDEPEFADAREAIEARHALTIDLLYGDLEGGQRAVTRFTLVPSEKAPWIASASRHWNIDRDNPR